MDARTGLVIGGLTAVAASVAVVTAVALTNTVALQDSPGSTVTAGRVLVPAASPSTTTPLATPPPAPPTETVAPQAEIAEVPAPVVVDSPSVASSADRAPAAPASPPEDVAATIPDDLESVIASAQASGSWDAVRSWAAAHGWSAGRTDALVERLERERARQTADKSAAPEAPAQLDSGAERQALVGAEVQQHSEPVEPAAVSENNGNGRSSTGGGRPADAGSNGHGNGAGPETKKGQSRDSPDTRD